MIRLEVDTPWQDHVDTTNRMIGDALHGMPQVNRRIGADQFCRSGQAVDGGCPFTARIEWR